MTHSEELNLNELNIENSQFQKLQNLLLQEQNFVPNRFVSLLSTGLDSPVAMYLMMRQGMEGISLSFLNGLTNSEGNRRKIIAVGKKLVELTNQAIYMLFVDYDRFLERIQSNCETRLTCIICKRTMMDTAKNIAQRLKAQFIINGDILGEQASQTLDNLYVVHQINKEIPVIRPLVGFDKLDVIKLSQKVGLFELSLLKGLACEFNPQYPETRANIAKVMETEKNLDRNRLRQEIFDSMELVILKP